VEALPLPEGVDAETWDELKLRFVEELESSWEDKTASRAPSGKQNQVRWIYATIYSDDPDKYSLSWRYQNAGDYNLDGSVNVSDLTLLAQHFGKPIADDVENARLDTDGSDKVDIGDISAVARNLGTVCTGYFLLAAERATGVWVTADYIPIQDATLSAGYLHFSLDRETRPQEKYLRVIPVDPGGRLGEQSFSALCDEETFRHAGSYLTGEAITLTQESTPPASWTGWLLGTSQSRPYREGPEVELVYTADGFHSVRAIVYNGTYARLETITLYTVTPNPQPVRCEFVPTPQGPLLFWSRGGVADQSRQVQVTRNDELLAVLERGSFYYLDHTAGTSTFTYQMRGLSDGLVVYFGEPFAAYGAEYESEHLYLIAEPREYQEDDEVALLPVIVANAHRLWMVPSLRIYIESDEAEARTAANADGGQLARKLATMFWPPAELVMFFQPLGAVDELGAFVDLSVGFGALDWANKGYSPPATVPVGRTIVSNRCALIRCPGPGAVLRPYLNTGTPFSFYIDAYRNMYSFAYCHSLSLHPFAIGPAESSVPVSGRLPLGKQPLPGDFTQDGVVNLSDVSPFACHCYAPVTEENAHIDQNGDGFITLLDLMYVLYYFGQYTD